MNLIYYPISLILITVCIIATFYFGHTLGSNQYHKVFQDQQIMITYLERENKSLALTNNYRFATCQNVLDKLGLIEQYNMAMGGD